MLYVAAALSTPEIIASLGSATSRCEVRRHESDSEEGDPIDVRCGSAVKSLGRALKGVSVDRIGECRLVLTVNAVHSPRLLDVSNCKGALSVKDIGSAWSGKLEASVKVKRANVEYVSYEKIPDRLGCYNVSITYDINPGSQNTAFGERKSVFCIEPR
jgi:hypothetical protein